MRTVRKSCNIGYVHQSHTSIVLLEDEDGIADPALWICGGSNEAQRARIAERV